MVVYEKKRILGHITCFLYNFWPFAVDLRAADLDAYSLVAENEHLILYLNYDTTEVAVQEKDSGLSGIPILLDGIRKRRWPGVQIKMS